MGNDGGGITGNVKASRAEIEAALEDFEHYTEWQPGMLEVKVLERDDEGRGTLIEIYIDAKIRKLRYQVRYLWDLPGGPGWDYVGGDMEDNSGRYTLVEKADGTTDVTVDLNFEAGFPVPAMMKKLIRDQGMKNSLSSLRKRVEK
jgi:hypothetical protein